MNEKNEIKIIEEIKEIPNTQKTLKTLKTLKTGGGFGLQKLVEKARNVNQNKQSGFVTNLSYSDLAYSLLCCCKCRRMQFTWKLKQKYVRFKQVEAVSEQFKEDLD